MDIFIKTAARPLLTALWFLTFLQRSVRQVHPFLLHSHGCCIQVLVPRRQIQVKVQGSTAIRIRQFPPQPLSSSSLHSYNSRGWRTSLQHLNSKASGENEDDIDVGIDVETKFKTATMGKSTSKTTISTSMTITTVQQRLNLESQFHRWKMLQDILEEEEEPSARDVNELLYLVLKSFMDNPRPRKINMYTGRGVDTDAGADAGADSMDMKTNPSPFLNDEQCKLLQNVLFEYDTTENDTNAEAIGLIYAIPTSSENGIDDSGEYNDERIVKNNEILDKYFQPDQVEEEEAFKSCWDIVMELYGREATKHAVQSGDRSWVVRSGIVRLLLHFDFLTDGLGEDVIIRSASASTCTEE